MDSSGGHQQSRLNYAAVIQPITPADIAAFQREQRALHQGGLDGQYVKFFLIVVFGLFFISFLATGVILSATTGDLSPFLLVACGLVVVAIIFHLAVAHRTKYLIRLKRLADTNGLKLLFDQNDPGYSGMIFDEGHSRKLKEALVFNDGIEVGNYSYVTGSGKNRQVHSFMYAKVILSRKLPHMVLDSRQNNFLGMTNLPDVFRSDQHLELEGDFNKYFSLYAPKQYERDALYVFTPDVMAAMIDSGQQYDIEIVDDMMFIYQGVGIDLLSPQRLDPLLATIAKLKGEVLKQSVSYSDERVGDRTQNIVAAEGQRLRSGVNWLIVCIVVGFFMLQIVANVWPDIGAFGYVIFWLAVMGLIFFSVIKRLQSR